MQVGRHKAIRVGFEPKDSDHSCGVQFGKTIGNLRITAVHRSIAADQAGGRWATTSALPQDEEPVVGEHRRERREGVVEEVESGDERRPVAEPCRQRVCGVARNDWWSDRIRRSRVRWARAAHRRGLMPQKSAPVPDLSEAGQGGAWPVGCVQETAYDNPGNENPANGSLQPGFVRMCQCSTQFASSSSCPLGVIRNHAARSLSGVTSCRLAGT